MIFKNKNKFTNVMVSSYNQKIMIKILGGKSEGTN